MYFGMYMVAQKIGTSPLYALTLSNINRFSKWFHCENQEKIRSNTGTENPTTPQVCRYMHYLVKCQVFYEQQLKTRRLL